MFKVGDYVRILVKHDLRSRSAIENAGKVFPITKINARPDMNYAYVMLDMPNCGGIWLDEIEPVSFTDKDFEYV